MGLRLFLALFPPAELADDVVAQLALLDLPPGRWVRAPQLHFTLAFLGDCEAAQLPAIRVAVDRAAMASARFALELGDVGAFPSLQRARVLFLDAREGSSELCALAQRLRDQLDAAGLAFDVKPFVPHLTVARFREAPAAATLGALREALRGRRWCFEAHELQLVQSRLDARGSAYQALHRAALRVDGGTAVH